MINSRQAMIRWARVALVGTCLVVSTTELACYTGNCYLEVNSYEFETTNAVDLTWSDGLRDSLCCSSWGVSQGCFETGVGCAPMVSFRGNTTRYELGASLTVPQITPDTPLTLQEGALSSDAYLATPDGTRMPLVLREG